VSRSPFRLHGQGARAYLKWRRIDDPHAYANGRIGDRAALIATVQKTGTPSRTSFQFSTWKVEGSMVLAAEAYATIASRIATWAL
jgi:hypothetical protein